MEKLLDALVDEITDRVLKKLSDQNSNWLNTIQYKVDVKNITGFNEAVAAAVENPSIIDSIRDTATDAAERAIREANFSVDVSF